MTWTYKSDINMVKVIQISTSKGHFIHKLLSTHTAGQLQHTVTKWPVKIIHTGPYLLKSFETATTMRLFNLAEHSNDQSNLLTGSECSKGVAATAGTR